MAEQTFTLPLTPEERELLWQGLAQWGGPASLSDELAVAMGFHSKADFFREARRLEPVITEGGPLSWSDWKRTLLATEIVFASAMVGAAWDWHSCTGLEDEETLALLRSVQEKVINGLPARPRE